MVVVVLNNSINYAILINKLLIKLCHKLGMLVLSHNTKCVIIEVLALEILNTENENIRFWII